MSNPSISIIVPIYNIEPYLRECVDSLINQTYPKIEIILVDDGSPDNCPAICDQYKNDYDNIVVIHKKNGGLVSARKAGLMASSFDYIAYVDGDDYVENDHFEKIADAIEKYAADIITTDYTSICDGKREIHEQVLAFEFLTRSEIEEIIPTMISTAPFFTFGIFPSVWTKCFKRDIAMKYQMEIPDSIVMGEDASLTYPCIQHADSICHIHEYGYMYRVRATSITQSYDSRMSTRIENLINYMSNQFDYKSKQMVDYIIYSSLLVTSNAVAGNQDLKTSVRSIKAFLDNEKVQYAINNGVYPLKYKILFWSIRNELFFLIRLYQSH